LSAASKPQFDEMTKIASATGQLRLDFNKIESIDHTGDVLLLQALRQIRKSGHAMAVTGLGHLVKLVHAAAGTGPEREQKMLFLLLLELFQVKGMEAEFEELALQYAVKFEVSPPAWEALPKTQTLAVEEPAEGTQSYALHGEVVGSTDAQLQGINAYAAQRQDVNIDMSDVRRMDFVSCGMFLNILSGLQQNSKHVMVSGANEMILALCRVMGVHKVATLIRNK
ncbi:MAG: STAS domain-containing protein, partial [Burkholderiales bacterium]